LTGAIFNRFNIPHLKVWIIGVVISSDGYGIDVEKKGN